MQFTPYAQTIGAKEGGRSRHPTRLCESPVRSQAPIRKKGANEVELKTFDERYLSLEPPVIRPHPVRGQLIRKR